MVLTTPIIEGLDGVQKMSKSLGNAIGIQEPPLEMYGKVMSISDAMMWRYYELLTDVQLSEIEKMKRESHPMEAKKDLARRIVTDFHSADAAARAAEDWAKQFQKKEAPSNAERVQVSFEEIKGSASAIRLDRLLVKCGFADSVAAATRSLEQGAVRIGENVERSPRIQIEELPIELAIRVGKRVKIAVIHL